MRRFALVGAVVLALAVAAPVSGRVPTYHGTFDDGQFYCGTTPVATPEIGGIWNVNVAGKRGVTTVDIFYDGSHHTSGGLYWGTVTDTSTGVIVSYPAAPGAPPVAIATVDGDAFSWMVSFTRTCGGTATWSYDRIVLTGPVGR